METSALDIIKRGFFHEWWGNRQVVEALSHVGSVDRLDDGRVLARMAHIVAADSLWLDRLLSEEQRLRVWPEMSLDEIIEQLDEVERRWRAYLTSLHSTDLERAVTYTNTAGEQWRSQVSDILMHVLLHASYHRGQIAAAIRRAGVDPPYTDYIHATRANLL